MRRIFGIMCVLVLAAGAGRAQQPDLGTGEQREAGRAIYEEKCSQCHGDDGDGNGVAKHYFSPTPRDFTWGLFKIRMTESGELPTDEDLKNVIREGMPYTGMPAWPGLSDDELSNVVYYIKTFSDDFADPDFMAAPIKIRKAPRYSDESAQKGKLLYEENKCADCHGELGRGYGKSASTLEDEWQQRVRPADLTKRWTFRGGSTREDIYRTFTTGLNGTPMPSYADLIDEEGRWNLVDYVYSFSRDEPDYSTVVTAGGIEGELDIELGAALFEAASPAFFPVFGQVMEPGRRFYPSANALEVRAVYNSDEIAIMLTWNDMTAEMEGSNSPSIAVSRFEPGTDDDTTGGIWSDAVAIQTLTENAHGVVKPYFLFGDMKNSVDLWFADLSKDGGEIYTGRGSASLEPAGESVPVWSSHTDGQWNVIFKRSRQREDGYSFDPSSFVPVAFSIWDGREGERGARRGVTGWYNMYLEPLQAESKLIPVAGYGLLTLLLEVGVIVVVRKRNGNGSNG